MLTRWKLLCLALCLALLPALAEAKLILGDTNDTVEVVTASAVSTINVHASWADITTTALTPGMTNSLITTATTTTVVAAPAASTQRQLKMLTIYNSHASSSNAISVQVFDGVNRAVLVKYTLLAGETLQWSEDENFRVIDAAGNIKVMTSGVGATGAAAPSNAMQICGTNGTNCAVPKVLTATPASNDPGFIVRNINPNLAADNSTNSTAKVPVMPCRANASAPTWTEGNQTPCSTDLAGNQRVLADSELPAAAAVSADNQSAPTAPGVYTYNMCFDGSTWDRCTASGVVDAANNAAAPANVQVVGLEAATQGTTQPTAATAGNVRRPVMSTDGAAYVRNGGPVTWACSLNGVGTTLTQCQAAPGASLKLYITGWIAQSSTSTAGLHTLSYGTGANCGTGTTALLFASTSALVASTANTAAPTVVNLAVPIVAAANNAVCVLGVVTNTTNITVMGYTAP